MNNLASSLLVFAKGGIEDDNEGDEKLSDGGADLNRVNYIVLIFFVSWL